MKVDQPFFAGLVVDTLARGESVVLRVQGASMLPWLREGAAVRIRPAAGRRLRRGDIALFLRAPDRPILHRIVAVHAAAAGLHYDCLGDAETGQPERVAAAEVIGLADLSPAARLFYLVFHRPRRALNGWLSRRGVRLRHG
jgi:hypothetical protein